MATSTIKFRAIALLVSGLFVAALGARAQSVLYITDGDSSALQAIDTTTGTLLYTAETLKLGGDPSYPIAVRDTIWLGYRDFSGRAREYNLSDGSPTGNAIDSPDVSWTQTVDGAVNGSFNYTFMAFTNSSTVYQTDANWTNAEPLFAITGSTLVGITFDNASGNLWISDTNTLYQYTLAGSLVSQFSASGYGPIAYQADTDTLWVVPNSSSSPLLQYSKTGSLLQSLAVTGRSGNVYGAEFSAIPEPSTYALLALGGGLLWLTARRRRA